VNSTYINCLSIIKTFIIAGVFSLTGCEKNLFSPDGIVSDIDGNNYNVVKIGKQYWFKENLKTTKYNNGVLIPKVTDGFQWTDLTSGAYSYYDDSKENQNIYGNLYNWYAVNTGNLCPMGWHVPSEADWEKLEEFLGGSYNAGGRMKAKGTDYWDIPNYGGINSSGFSALPAGSFSTSLFSGHLSQYIVLNYYTGFWSSTEHDLQTALQRELNSDDHILGLFNDAKFSGLSVRCIKDN
jgi:uncharacterized protein (TIGR02145 family)